MSRRQTPVTAPRHRTHAGRPVLLAVVCVSLVVSALGFLAPRLVVGVRAEGAPARVARVVDAKAPAGEAMRVAPAPGALVLMTPTLRASVASIAYPGVVRLRAIRAEERRKAAEAAARLARTPIVVRVLSFNVLGSSHTSARGDKPHYASGVTRAHWAADIIRGHDADLVGLQEVEFDQLRTLQGDLGDYTFWPGSASDEESVRTNLMWRTSRFTVVDSGSIRVRFVGLARTDPYVLLEDRQTGRRFWFFNVHNSPNRHAAGTFEAERRAELSQEVDVLNRLDDSAPVLLTGDFNDHVYTYCRIVGSTRLRAAAGGSVSPCIQPSLNSVDWIFGYGATWSDVYRDHSSLVQRATDHHVFAATATIGPFGE